MEPLREEVKVQSNSQYIQVNEKETAINSIPTELIQQEFERLKNICCPDVVEQAQDLQRVSRKFADIGNIDKAVEVALYTESSWCNGNLPNRGNAFAYIIKNLLENKLAQEAIKIANSMPTGYYEDSGLEKAAYLFSKFQLPDQVDILINKISEEHIRNRIPKNIAIQQESTLKTERETARKLMVSNMESENPGEGELIVGMMEGMMAKVSLFQKIEEIMKNQKVKSDNPDDKEFFMFIMDKVENAVKMEDSEIKQILELVEQRVLKNNSNS